VFSSASLCSRSLSSRLVGFCVVQGDSEFLGRTEATPIVKLNAEKSRPAVLQWLPVTKRGSPRGELLAAFELFPVCFLYLYSVIHVGMMF